MKGGPTDPPNRSGGGGLGCCALASMKGGPTDPPNWRIDHLAAGVHVASMKGGPTDPPNASGLKTASVGGTALQ